MADYIDREKYCTKICCCNKNYCGRTSCAIWTAKSEDVTPVVHGKWKYKEEWGRLVTNCCSICGQSLTTVYGEGKMNFCPNCGAKMDAK